MKWRLESKSMIKRSAILPRSTRNSKVSSSRIWWYFKDRGNSWV